MAGQVETGSPQFSLRSKEDFRKLCKSLAISAVGYLIGQVAVVLAHADVAPQWVAALSFASFVANTAKLYLTDTRSVAPFWLGVALIIFMPTAAIADQCDCRQCECQNCSCGRQGRVTNPLSEVTLGPAPFYLPSPIQKAPPAGRPQQMRPGEILLLRDAWIGPNRVRGRLIHVQPVAPGVLMERGEYRWWDPLGVWR